VVAGNTTITVAGTGSAGAPYQISANICASLAAMTNNSRELVFATDLVPVLNGSGGCELVSIPSSLDSWNSIQSINVQTDSYTVLVSDAGKMITLDNALPITLTFPLGLGLSVGQHIDFAQLGVGQVTVVGSGGATILATPGPNLRDRYSAAGVIVIGTDTYLAVGDLSA
jgi:hypothetical protein